MTTSLGRPASYRRDGQRYLGDALVDAGSVGAFDLAEALEEQANTGERLGQILLSREKIGAYGLAQGLASIFDMTVVDLGTVVPDPAAVIRVPEVLARRLHALPLGFEDGELVIAIDDPANLTALDDLQSVAGTTARFVVAQTDQLEQAIDAAWQVHSPDGGGAATVSVTPTPAAIGDDRPVVRFIDQLLARALNEQASDIHLEATLSGGRVRFRVDGMLHDVLTVDSALLTSATARLKVMADMNIAVRRVPQDGRMSLTVSGVPIDVRVGTLPTSLGEAVVLRLLDTSRGLLDIADLGFNPDTLARFEAAYNKPWGEVLVTGPTGSGKTTTLYAAVAKINRSDQNIVTVENPVEYQIDGIKQMQVAEAAGLTFDRALRAILRCDPDVILVGEIRDAETARIAAEAALTGHLVLSTMHTNDAASAPIRLVEMGLQPYLVASSLDCVVAQRLTRGLCLHCREEYAPTEFELMAADWELTGLPAPESLYRHQGCPDCNGTGYRGRFAVHELLRVTPEIREVILANRSVEALRAVAAKDGMLSMRADGLMKAAAGQTSFEEIIRVTT